MLELEEGGFMKHIRTGLLIALLPFFSVAEPLTAQALEGRWLFTHMILDGQQEVPVNMLVDFQPDGSAVSYGKDGNERDRATYTLGDNTIEYTDQRGQQNWEVLSFEANSLHVDHKGAEMFFIRP